VSPRGAPAVSFCAPGGVTFLHSTLADGTQSYAGPWAQRYVLSLYSSIGNWDTISLDADSKKDKLD